MSVIAVQSLRGVGWKLMEIGEAKKRFSELGQQRRGVRVYESDWSSTMVLAIECLLYIRGQVYQAT